MMRTMVFSMIIRSIILKRKTYDTKRISYYDIDEEYEDDDEDEEEIYMVTSGRPVTVSAVITGIMDIHHIPGGRKGGNHDDSSGDDDHHHYHLVCELVRWGMLVPCRLQRWSVTIPSLDQW